MSDKGIDLAAKVFRVMQETRNELMKIGVKSNDHTDILLAQMLENGKDAMKDRFIKLTLRK